MYSGANKQECRRFCSVNKAESTMRSGLMGDVLFNLLSALNFYLMSLEVIKENACDS
jgi:hypothetical protein